MKLLTKINDLKNLIGSNYSSFAQTLDSASKGASIRNNDFANAVIYALRKIGKNCQIYKKSVLIPLESNKRYYSVYVNHYTKDLIDYVKPTQLAFVGFDTAGELNIGEINVDTWESIERNQYIDSWFFGNKCFGSEVAFKSSLFFEDDALGSLNSVTTTPTTTALPCTTSVTSGDIIFNLEYAEKLYEWYTTALSTGTTPNVDLNVATAGWVIGDKLWVSNALCSFMLLTFQAIPQSEYFNTLTTSSLVVDIPILPQFEDDINDIALAYLYKIIATRNPAFAGTYASLLRTKLIKTEDEVMRDILPRASSIESIVAERYNPLGQRYGR
jgi:hypothetical protein